jgi:hypothetical protein
MEAISRLERGSIMRTLRDSGKWEADRGGAHIRLYTFTAGGREQIHYIVGRGSLNVSGQARDVADALAKVNHIAAGRRDERRVAPAPPPVLSGMPRGAYRLPYKDSEL